MQKLTEELKATQFRQLFDNMAQAYALHKMIYDENNNPINFNYMLVNKAFTDITGIKEEYKGGHQ